MSVKKFDILIMSQGLKDKVHNEGGILCERDISVLEMRKACVFRVRTQKACVLF